MSEASLVPTSQRPINGLISGGLALAVYAILDHNGVGPELANLGGAAASGMAATVGDWARGVMESRTAKPSTLPGHLGTLIFMMLSRVG